MDTLARSLFAQFALTRVFLVGLRLTLQGGFAETWRNNLVSHLFFAA
jgi:hypothetical protein